MKKLFLCRSGIFYFTVFLYFIVALIVLMLNVLYFYVYFNIVM